MLKQLYYEHIFLTPLLLFSVRLVRLVNICLCLYYLTLALRLIRSTISSSYRLETSFGVTGDALKWIASYLSARSQRIMINGILSDLSFGVPQGSCVGPLLFSAYASKLFQVIKNHLPNAHAYADDTQLHLSFKSDSSMDQTEARSTMERCIRTVLTDC